jgi:NTP pyrophosphatase (non-canonical NTP hydrolase)
MTFDDYQLEARRTMNHQLSERETLLDAAAGLAEEAGEALAIVRKHVFQQRPLHREQMVEELGDALWCLSATASALDIRLRDIAAQNIQKLRIRHPETLSGGDT